MNAKCPRCPVPDPLVCTATRREMAGRDLCSRLDEPGFAELLLAHALPETPEQLAQVIADGTAGSPCCS